MKWRVSVEGAVVPFPCFEGNIIVVFVDGYFVTIVVETELYIMDFE